MRIYPVFDCHCEAEGRGNLHQSSIYGERSRSVEQDPRASPLLRILRQFVGDLFVQDVFDGKGDYALAGLLEERLYFADGVG